MAEQTPAATAVMVLVTDDHPAVREGLAGILRAAGYVVCEAGSGEQAVEIAASLRPNLVLMDVLMPGMSGIEAARQIIARDAAARVLMLTADDSPLTVRAALRAGAAGYLTKAATSGSVLVGAVRRAAAGEAVFVPAGLSSLGKEREGQPAGRDALTEREAEIAAFAATGAARNDIAAALALSPRTVDNHLSQIYRKLGVASRTQLVRVAADLRPGLQVQAGQARGIVFVDVITTAGKDRDWIAARSALLQILRDAMTSSGISWSASSVEDRGDGVLIVMPPGVPVSVLIGPFLEAVAGGLETSNRLVAGRQNIQLRVAVDAGTVTTDQLGIIGQAVIRCVRMLDAAAFKAAMSASGSALGVIVSESAFDEAVSQGVGGPGPAASQPVDLPSKDMQFTARMWFTGSGVPPALRPISPQTGTGLSGSPPPGTPENLPPLRFRMLGPVEVWTGQEWSEISAPKWRTLLGCLLLQPGELVTADDLISELWGDNPPSKATNLVSIYVLRLRRLIGDADGLIITRRTPGYMLSVTDGEIDAQRFEILVRAAREMLTTHAPDGASACLDQALGLWRGEPLADVALSPRLEEKRGYLAELQLDAAELKIAADLNSGGHTRVIPQIRQALASSPFREELWLLLMRALHESGQTSEALDAYSQARQALCAQPGVGPGAGLRRMHADIQRVEKP